jgi:adenine-specific DNA-methyltransferase
VPARNYVLLKRFSSKEEKRRLTAGCFLRRQAPSTHLGIENHVNYVYHGERELTEDETFGIAALFNSRLIDRYFRAISGNTQVNATEIRAMSFLDLEWLGRIGKQVRRNTAEAERIILGELGISGSLRKCLVGV